MARSKTNTSYGAFGLEFIGSLIFLATAAYLISTHAAGYGSWLGSWTTGAASFWLPLIYPAALLGSIALFLMSFGTLSGWGGKMAGMKSKLVWFTAAALLLLTAGNSWMYAVILGFILAILGGAVVMMGEKM